MPPGATVRTGRTGRTGPVRTTCRPVGSEQGERTVAEATERDRRTVRDDCGMTIRRMLDGLRAS